MAIDTSALAVYAIPAILFGLIAVSLMWFIAYLKRYFMYLSGREMKYINYDIAILVYRYLKFILLLLLLTLFLWLFKDTDAGFNYLWSNGSSFIEDGLTISIIIFAALLLSQITHRIMAYYRGELKSKPKHSANPRTVGIIEVMLRSFILLIALFLIIIVIIAMFGQSSSVLYATYDFFVINSSVLGLISGIIIIIYFADEIVRSILEEMEKRPGGTFTPEMIAALRKGSRYGLWTTAWTIIIYLMLQMLHMGEIALLIFSIMLLIEGVFLAFMISTFARSISAGMAIMNMDAYKTGENVRIGDVDGIVVEHNIFVTKIKDIRGRLLTIPNSEVIQGTIRNYSRVNVYGASVRISVPFNVPHERVEELLISAAKKSPGIASEPEPIVRALKIDGGNIVYEIVAYAKGYENEENIRSNIIYAVQNEFLMEGSDIEIV